MKTMKLFEYIKFLIKKFIMSKNEYDTLIYKASVVDKLSECMYMDINTESEWAYGKYGEKLANFNKSSTYIFTINVPKVLEAFNIKFEVPYKINIIE